MKTSQFGHRVLFPAIILALLVSLTIGCTAVAPTSTPVPPAQPAQPAAPTVAPQPTSVVTPATPTSISMIPSPTRVLPTPTFAVGESPVYGGMLRYMDNIDGTSLDSADLTGLTQRAMAEAIYEKLVDVDTEFRMVPRLAGSWDISSDGKNITFHIVQGASFQDGASLNAQAIKAHFDRILDPSVGSRYRGDFVSTVDSITADNDYALTFHLKSANRAFFAVLADYAGFIESPSAVKKYNSYSNPKTGDYARNPVGTGPFKLTEWTTGSRMTASRSDSYRTKGLPYLDSFRILHVPEQQVQLAMLRTGEGDISYNIRAADVSVLKANPSLKLAVLEAGTVRGIAFSVDTAPYNNKDLRSAIAYSIDRQTLANTYYAGQAQPAYTALSNGWGANPGIIAYAYDAQKAKQKLSDAGYSNGVSITYWCQSTAESLQLCETNQSFMKAVGIDAKIQPAAPSEYFAMLQRREIHMIDRFRFPRADPSYMLDQLFYTKGSSNPQGYSNLEVDKLLDQARGTYDTAQAKKSYDQAQKIIADDIPWVFLVWQKQSVGLNKNVKNFELIPDLYLRPAAIWLAK